MKIQDYLLKKSDSRGALWAVFVLTLCESVFLFVPPEVFMMPSIVANKKRAVPVVIAASLGSLIGGIISYAIGMWLFGSIGQWLINMFSDPEQFLAARQMFAHHGVLIIFIAAFTPMPYKLLSLAAGFIGFNPALFVTMTGIFRTLRFALFGFLLWKFQERANIIVKKYFWQLMAISILVAALGLWIMFLI